MLATCVYPASATATSCEAPSIGGNALVAVIWPCHTSKMSQPCTTWSGPNPPSWPQRVSVVSGAAQVAGIATPCAPSAAASNGVSARSEEHTSELQSLAYLVCRLLLEKK